MRNIFVFIIAFLLFSTNIIAQESHSFGPFKDWYAVVWQKVNANPPHQAFTQSRLVGNYGDGNNYYEERTVSFWKWTETDISMYGTVTSVNIKLKAHPTPNNQDFQFALHNISHNYHESGINFFNEFSVSNQLIERTRPREDPQGNVYFNETFTSGPILNAINAAIQSGNYYLALGIMQTGSSRTSEWAISSYDGTGDFHYPSIEITVIYTTPNQYYSFVNKIEGTQNYGSLIVDNDKNNPISSNSTPRTFSWNTTHTVRTNELPFVVNWSSTGKTEKHLRFFTNEPFDYSLNRTFTVLPSERSIQEANFAETKTATITTQLLEGSSSAAGNIELKDPWRYYSDANNDWFQSSQFVSYNAPFEIQNNSTYSYGGIFLNQGITPQGQWIQPYYLINAPSSQTFGTILGYFSFWDGSNVTFQNSTTQQTGVVFNAAGATAIAKYKGHLITNSVNALASNSQRKIIQDENFDNLHLVYESGGNIYSTYSDDNGETWSPELRVNSTLGGCFSPSITYSQSRYQVIAAWLQDIGGARYAVIAFCYGSGDPWTQIQSIASPNAQQLQISSMTNGGSSDLLVWREGTSQLKGALRASSTSTFGTVYSLLFKDYNYISGFSLGAFGRSDRWDLVWVENGNLYYSSIYDYESLSLPKLDYYTNPSVVASASDWIHYNPSIVKTGNNLTVAWESYYEEIVKRNIKVVQITPNLPSYPTIGTATTFTNLGSTSYYYTPSISSHSNNDLSLSWRNGASTILCAKRVNGSWQSVTTLGSGIDPSASERFDNTQNSSIHFRRGTSLPYILANTTITTSTGRELDKSGSDGGSLFAGEGRELFLRSAKGTSSFALINASTGVIPIVFEEVDDSRNISAINDIRIALRSKPFISTGELSVELAYHSYGELPPLRKVRVLLEEVSEKGVSIHPLGIAGEFEGSKRSNETVSFTIPKTERPIRILIDPVVRDDSMHIEVSKWYTVDASNASMEKSGKESQQRRIVVPAVLDLLQNYPNPFNPVTTIEFTVPKDGNAKLTVYNSLGQVVATLYDGFVQSGYVQKATFDGTQLSSGVYYSRLEYDGKSIMKKLMLLK